MPLIHLSTPEFLYYAPPKTGSTSVIKALQATYYDAEVLYCKHGIYHDPSWKELPHIITVRNPYSRAVSLWQFFRQDMSFSLFLRSTDLCRFRNKLWHAMPCSWWETSVPAEYSVIHLGNVVSELRAVPFARQVCLGHHNQTGQAVNVNGMTVRRDRQWWEYYGPGDDKIVAQLYAQDFERYQYNTDINQAID